MSRRNYPRASSRAYQGTCAVCGDVFLTGYPYTLYCGPECRQEAARARMRDRQPLLPARALRQVVEPTREEPVAAGGMEVREWHGTPIGRRADGYVNATAMCKANGKHLPHYMANDRTDAYIAALAPVVGIPTTALVESRQGGTPALQGTWVHPRLAVDLARWISPAFAVWMDGWFLETLARGLPTTTPTTPGITVTARTEREAMQLWQAAIEAETTRALRLTLGTTCRTDDGLRFRRSNQWRFVAC